MPIQGTDLLPVQRGTNNYRATATEIKAFTTPPATATVLGGIKVGRNLDVDPDGTLNSDIPEALRYKGAADVTAPAPASPSVGDVWIVANDGIAAASWNGVAGQPLKEGEFLIYDGFKWSAFNYGSGGVGGVVEIKTTLPLRVDNTDPDQPLLSIDGATQTTAGVARLADNADIAAGTPGRVVTADQLKATNDALTTATGGGLTGLTATAPVVVTGAGAVRDIAVSAATTAATGVVRLADAPALTAGLTDRVTTADQLKAVIDDLANYLKKDFSLLPAIP